MAIRSRGADGNCRFGAELAEAFFHAGHSVAVAAAAADFATKSLRVVGGKAAPV